MEVDRHTRLPKISIVTVCRNHGHYIEQTIQSVLDQNYPNLEYIVLDGASTDNTVQILKKYAQYFHYWHSKPDAGHHVTLSKGLKMTSGEIMGWLNADDFLMPGSLRSLGRYFTEHKSVEWITGVPNYLNNRGAIFNFDDTRSELWSKQTFLFMRHAAIQQESTFWRRSLWDKAGATLNTDCYPLAFDYELWCRFFRFADLHLVQFPVGAFRISAGVEQKSTMSNRASYLYQCEMARNAELKRMPNSEYIIRYLNSHFLLPLLKPFYFLDVPLFRSFFLSAAGIPSLK